MLAGCGRPHREAVLAPATSQATAAPVLEPIQFPRDDAPHDDLTEWWYYTGHLAADDGRRYGFEFVVFQTVRGEYPVAYFSQFAITDRARTMFQHVGRGGQGSQVRSLDGYDLSLGDWRLLGSMGRSDIHASMQDYELNLHLETQKPVVLHDDDGIVSFGAAGDSYYYSYTRLSLQGTLIDHGAPLMVRGQAWFDHQWGNFLVLGGGWDWFSAQLDDGSDLMLNQLRDDRDRVVGVWGTYIDPSGGYRTLNAQDFSIRPDGAWTSPRSGGVYPMGWSVTLNQPAYELRFTPALLDQELFSESASPTYWEGDCDVEGTRNSQPVRGQAYVELTGYARR